MKLKKIWIVFYKFQLRTKDSYFTSKVIFLQSNITVCNFFAQRSDSGIKDVGIQYPIHACRLYVPLMASCE